MRKLPIAPKYDVPEIETFGDSSAADTPESFENFAENCDIISEGEIKKFRLFAFQRQLAALILSGDYRVIYIVKSRQLGITLLLGCILAYKAIKQHGFSAFFISLGQGESTKISRRIKRFFASWNTILDRENTREHSLKNQSTIEYFPNTTTVGRGDSSNFQVYDECAFYPVRELKGSAAASKIWGGKESTSIALSTPSDKQSEFYQLISEGNPEPFEAIAEKIVSGEYPPLYFWLDDRGALKICIHFTAVPKFRDNPELYINLLYEEGLTPEQINRESNLTFDDLGDGQFLSYQLVNEQFSLSNFETLSDYRKLGYDIAIGLDPCGFGKDQLAVAVLVINEKNLSIIIIKQLYFDRPDYEEVEKFFAEIGLEDFSLRARLYIENNGVGVAAVLHFSRIAPCQKSIKVIEFCTTDSLKTDTATFFKWAIEKRLIEGLNDPKTKEQIKRFDFGSMQGAGSADDGVSAIFHALQHCNFLKWYAAHRGVSIGGVARGGVVTGQPLKTVRGFGGGGGYEQINFR